MFEISEVVIEASRSCCSRLTRNGLCGALIAFLSFSLSTTADGEQHAARQETDELVLRGATHFRRRRTNSARSWPVE